MNYILSVLPVLPIAALIAAAVYAGILLILRRKRSRPGVGVMLAEFVLVGWAVMFIYVTQIMSFGNGMGDRYNLTPLRQFVTAFRYGTNNAAGVWQFLLNIIMFVPLGLLLPIVFRRLRTWHGVLIVSLALTVATELLQLISCRGTDIDDVIANTVGGLCGFALYLVAVGLGRLIFRRDIAVSGCRLKLAVGIVILALTAGVFVLLCFCDGSSKYGNMYYGHLIPNRVEVNITPDDEPTERAVYRYAEQTSVEALQEGLQEFTGFEGEWTENHGDETFYSLSDSDTRVIFIFPYNKWSVYYEYGVSGEAASEEIDEAAALAKAGEYLEQFGIDSSEMTYDAESSFTEDDSRYLYFTSDAAEGDTILYGSVLVELGTDGRLISISDSRISCEYVEDAQCISMADSIEVAQEVGCGEWQGTGVVESVEESYSFISETGYLIPVWRINGYLYDDSQTLAWHPEIEAVK